MDRRTIAAMGVIILIFILLPYYWEWIGFSPGESETPQADSTQVVSGELQAENRDTLPPRPTDSMPGDLAAIDSTFQPTDTTDLPPEESFEVETPLYVARISSRGGSITSFKLKKYHYLAGPSDGEPVDLVPRHNGAPLVFELPDAGGLQSSQINFTANRKSIALTRSGADSARLVLTGASPGGAPVRLSYTFRRDSYLLGMAIDLQREEDLRGATRVDLSWKGGLSPTEVKLAEDYKYFAAYVRQGGEVAKFDDFDDGLLQEGSSGSIDWVATKSKYFVAALMREGGVADDFSIHGTETAHEVGEQKFDRRIFDVRLGNRLEADASLRFRIYLGPVDYKTLSVVGQDLDRVVEMGFWLFRPFAIAILWFVTALHKIIPNYGWVIIIFTVVMKIVFFPFSRKNYTQMARMKALQPRMKELQEKYKEQPQELNKRMLKLYKEEKFNPFGGCIWMLPQLPVFWALFTVFRSAIDLRGAGFLWLTDLSQPSMVLAIIMAAAMLLQQALTNKDPKQRFMVFALPALMFFLFRNFPAGLVLYWTVYNVLSIVEQKSVERGLTPATAPATVEPGPNDSPPRRKRAKK